MRYRLGDIVFLKKGTLKKYSARISIEQHPALLLFFDGHMWTFSPLSSKMDKVNSHFPYNIPIKSWKEAHILKPSFVRTDQRGRLTNKDILKVVGTLTSDDLEKIQRAFIGVPAESSQIMESFVIRALREFGKY